MFSSFQSLVQCNRVSPSACGAHSTLHASYFSTCSRTQKGEDSQTTNQITKESGNNSIHKCNTNNSAFISLDSTARTSYIPHSLNCSNNISTSNFFAMNPFFSSLYTNFLKKLRPNEMLQVTRMARDILGGIIDRRSSIDSQLNKLFCRPPKGFEKYFKRGGAAADSKVVSMFTFIFFIKATKVAKVGTNIWYLLLATLILLLVSCSMMQFTFHQFHSYL